MLRGTGPSQCYSHGYIYDLQSAGNARRTNSVLWTGVKKQLYQIHTTTVPTGEIILGSGTARCGRRVASYPVSSTRVIIYVSSSIGRIYCSRRDWTSDPYSSSICTVRDLPSPSVTYYFACCTSLHPASGLPTTCPKGWGRYRASSAQTFPTDVPGPDLYYSLPYSPLDRAPQYCLRNNSIRL